MRFIQTSDWHITKRCAYADIKLEYLSKNVDSLAEYGKAKNVNFFALLGDIFNVVNPTEEERLYLATQLQKLLVVAPVYLIPGNHDSNEQLSAFSALNKLVSGNLTIFEKPSYVGKYKAVFLPYSENIPKLLLKIDKRDNIDIVFSHFSLIGAKVNKEGFKLKSWIDHKLLEKYTYVGLGDIHKQQNIGNCYYAGSLHRINFGEIEDSKCFLYVKIDNGEVSVKPIETDDIEYLEYNVDKEFKFYDYNFKLHCESIDKKKFVVKIKYLKEYKEKAKELFSYFKLNNFVIDVVMSLITEDIEANTDKVVDYRKPLHRILYDYLKLDKELKKDKKKENYSYVKRLLTND